MVAVHQPNFFPWLPFFEKIVRADMFVILDDVQYPRTSKGTWVNRVNILNNGKAQYLTAPIRHVHNDLPLISDIQLVSDQPWREKTITTLKHQYGKARHAREFMEPLCSMVANQEANLARYNHAAIQSILALLDYRTDHLVLSSGLGIGTTSAQRIADITKKVGGSVYYSGKGAVSYQDAEFYAANGIQLMYQEFNFHPYVQFKSSAFVPGLSVLDALMNCGKDGTRDLLSP